MSEKALKWIINIAGIVCLYAFLSVRILPLFNLILKEKFIPEYWENTKYGELYYFSFIKHFREDGLPEYDTKYRFTDKHPDIDDADILTFGDSFFDFTRMETFPEQLGDSLHKKVFYHRFDRPLQYLSENNYSNNESKILLFETAERFLHDRFFTPHKNLAKPDQRSTIRKAYTDFRMFIFLDESEVLYNQLLNRSYLTTDIYSTFTTLKFDLFGSITTKTPKYSLNENVPWLFGWRQVDDSPRSFYYQHTQQEIDNYCDNITQLANDLKKEYNLDFVLIIIPSKYTVYHTVINNDKYNGFITRMYAALDERGIKVVKFYDEYMEQYQNELLYYGTDTHWTNKGLEIALNKTIQVIKEMPATEPVNEVDNYGNDNITYSLALQ